MELFINSVLFAMLLGVGAMLATFFIIHGVIQEVVWNLYGH